MDSRLFINKEAKGCNCLIIAGHESNWLEVTSGVPQGSILGRLMFLIYINDLPSKVATNIDLFADDSVLHHQISTHDDSEYFQENLHQSRSGMVFYIFSSPLRQKRPLSYEYNLNGAPLKTVEKHRHLGVWLQSSLSWEYHISSICGKANRVLGLIRRTFGYKNPDGVEIAFKSLVRPALEVLSSMEPMHTW